MPRKICVVTSSRADYGLLSGLITLLEADEKVDLYLVVSGAHLAGEFGNTHLEVENDGFRIHEKVEMLRTADTPLGISDSIGQGVANFGRAFNRFSPELLVLLGDRVEILAAAIAAMTHHIPIAHIHGGESSEGAIDEAIRHSVTKMSHLHLVSAEPYRNRVIQLGEDPAMVFNVGALGIDNILKQELPSRARISREINFDLGSGSLLLVTYHPMTLGVGASQNSMSELLAALANVPEAKVVFTKANADEGGRAINNLVEGFGRNCPGRVYVTESLGRQRYLGLLRAADTVLGNSSSGIIEAPFLGTPTVNIGDRQKGRLRCPSIIDCGESREAIAAALNLSLSPGFQEKASRGTGMYGHGNAAKQIHKHLMQTELEKVIWKSFRDIAPSEQGS